MLRNISSLLTGFRYDTITEGFETANIAGKNVIIAPGIRMEDKMGYECARKSGWIMNYKTLQVLADSNYIWDLKIGDANDMFLYFSTAVLRLYANRKNAKVNMEKEQRAKIVDQIFDQLLSNTELSKDTIAVTGYLVLRYHREQRTTPQSVVTEAIGKYVSMGVMPPVIITPQAVEHIKRTHDLLKLEKEEGHASVLFQPEVKPTTSTQIEDDLNASCHELEDEYSAIEFEQDAIRGEITSFLEKTICDVADTNDLNEIVTNLNDTLSQQRRLVIDTNSKKAELDQLRNAIREKFLEYENEISELKQLIGNKDSQLQQKGNEIEEMQADITTTNNERQTEIVKLELEISKMESKQAKQREEGVRIPVSVLNEAEEKISSYEEEIETRKAKEAKLRQRLNRINKDCEDAINTKTIKMEALELEKTVLTAELKSHKQQLETQEQNLVKKEAEKQSLRELNISLSNRMIELNSKTLELAALQKVADDSEKAISKSPKFSKLKRQDAISDDTVKTSDIYNMLSTEHEPTALIATMTLKEATSMVPRWQSHDNIATYCKKIKNAWELCEADGFTEEKFCKVLRLHMSESAAQVFDNLGTEKKKKVDDVTSALMTRLDRQQIEYLQDYSTAQKGPLESHSAFALRIQRLFNLGTGQDSETSTASKRLIVETFLNGLPLNEASALRLVASDTELTDVDELAKRAARSGRTQITTVNAVPNYNRPLEERTKLPDKQTLFTKNRFRGACHFCKIQGHTWRRCYKRAKQNPQWIPESQSKDMTSKKTA